MSYSALYRTLRPKVFEDVIGQQHIVKTLINQIESNKISHAYLFSGTRGTGKTSCAKIFARAVNCVQKTGASPCNICEFCMAALENRSLSIIEIDAASNNGVDNIRDIVEEVKYPPAEGKYKVYIIDEVHMLSTGAFNALLKTLEEPPKHTIFILATTDPQKLPATILSRCHRFSFKRLLSADLVDSLKAYLDGQKIIIEENALKYIAQISDGAMRDALSILDQSLTFFADEEITLEKIRSIVGAVDDAILFELTNALLEKNSFLCLELIEKLIIDGKDINQFVASQITHFRNLLVAKALKAPHANALDLSMDSVEKLLEQSSLFTVEQLVIFIENFSLLQSKIKYEKQPRILLEVSCITLCLTEEEKTPDAPVMKTEVKAKPKPKPEPEPVVDSSSDIGKVISTWRDFVKTFETIYMGILMISKPLDLNDGFLTIQAPDKYRAGMLKETLIQENLLKIYDLQLGVKITF